MRRGMRTTRRGFKRMMMRNGVKRMRRRMTMRKGAKSERMRMKEAKSERMRRMKKYKRMRKTTTTREKDRSDSFDFVKLT